MACWYLVVARDGAHAPTRPKGGRSGRRGPGVFKEAKGFRGYLLDGKERIIPIALLGDGAEWLGNALIKCFPNGREVLDYHHFAEHVHKVAKLQYGASLADQQWAEYHYYTPVSG